MSFFQTYANVPAAKTAEQRAIQRIARRVPQRVRKMMQPGPVTVFRPADNAVQGA